MSDVFLGVDGRTKRDVEIPRDAFRTHFHLIGGTGKGKTTAIHALLHQLLIDSSNPDCFFIFDKLGGLSNDLLLWMASPYCTDDVRDRLVYIEPSNEDYVIGFNPLLYQTAGEGFYKVQRATEIILRAWESMNIEAMPRLARWTFNAFWAVAQLGLTIADCAHLLVPGSPYFPLMMQRLPQSLQAEWAEINAARGEAARVLESTRNRLKPYFESSILRRMFSATTNRLDVRRFMREGRIVLINLEPRNRIAGPLGNSIGGLILNEVLATARSIPPDERRPTFLLLDEFQNFVGPDIEDALPEVRQLELRLILSHQSLNQLQHGDIDLTNMIFQAQSRMVFGVQGRDADDLAQELASMDFDPLRIKDQNFTSRQRVVGHEVRLLRSWSDGEQEAQTWSESHGQSWSKSEQKAKSGERETKSNGKSEGHSRGISQGGSRGRSHSQGIAEHLLPIHEDFVECSSRTFYSFQEQRELWAQKMRRLKTGHCLMRLVDDDALYEVAIERSAPGILECDIATLHREFPEAIEAVERLKDRNFHSEFFVSPADIDRETETRLQAVLRPAIEVQTLTNNGAPKDHFA